MLIQFSVKNFMSFKTKQEFSMEAGIGNENLNNVIINDKINDKILKSTAIYGANASGKTNLIKAFLAAITLIKLSNNRQPGELLTQMEPFAFDEKTKNAPCEFEFIFYTNSNKYIYGFKADKYKVHEEYLYQYFSAKPTRIFERLSCNEYKFLQSDENKLNAIKNQNLENKLFLATATTWNYDKTKAPFLWLTKNIETYSGGMELNVSSFKAYEEDKDKSLKQFTLKLLEKSDIVIKDYNVEIEEKGEINSLLGQKDSNLIKNITMTHEVVDENNNIGVYNLNFFNESSGTKILFAMAPILKSVFDNGKIIIIDEIERSLHPNLVKLIISFFHDLEINKNNAQLIFNTHDTNLLSLSLFRRDQIWFADKDSKNASTELYPLDDFSVRKKENIQKGYLSGRYGAIPLVI